MNDDLYSLTIETSRNERILYVTGARETLLDVAVRAMLDCSEAWDPRQALGYPQFRVSVQKFQKFRGS